MKLNKPAVQAANSKIPYETLPIGKIHPLIKIALSHTVHVSIGGRVGDIGGKIKGTFSENRGHFQGKIGDKST